MQKLRAERSHDIGLRLYLSLNLEERAYTTGTELKLLLRTVIMHKLVPGG